MFTFEGLFVFDENFVSFTRCFNDLNLIKDFNFRLPGRNLKKY